MSLELWNYYRSSTSYRVRIALHLKNLPFIYRPVHLLENGGQQHQQDFRKLNPLGEVPCLVNGPHVIAQSLAILTYLEELQPKPALFPQDSYLKAKVWQLAEVINAGTHPLANLKVMQYLERELHIDDTQRKAWQQLWIAQGLKAFEKSLEPISGRFCVGDQLSAADLCLIPQLFSARRFGVDLTGFQKLREIENRCLEIEAFQKAHPDRQPDTPKA